MANRTRDKVASLANRTQSEDYFNGTTVPELGSTVDALQKPKRQPAQPMLTCAYSVKNVFLHEDSILSKIDKIRDIPLHRGPGRRGSDLPAAHRVRSP